ncbi:MAG: peptidylprolyl isomerase [Deltaproteobacteria bacterium]|nr:MAG: peptidylprolyl isomerase [Deltaproteobacteria bacterium]
MTQAKTGDTVKVHYTGKLESGEIFDSSVNRDPLEFVIGGGNIIPGFENGVLGMEEGSSVNITIPPEEAYGNRNEQFVVQVNRNEFPENITPQVGLQLQMTQPNGEPVVVRIVDMSDDTITLDANHPLAGETLFFEVELVKIVLPAVE